MRRILSRAAIAAILLSGSLILVLHTCVAATQVTDPNDPNDPDTPEMVQCWLGIDDPNDPNGPDTPEMVLMPPIFLGVDEDPNEPNEPDTPE